MEVSGMCRGHVEGKRVKVEDKQEDERGEVLIG